MPNYQLNLPPVEVEPLYRTQPVAGRTQPKLIEPINLLKIARGALVRTNLSQRWFAASLGVSEQLASAQLSDHNEDKHLSARRLSRIDDGGFWREFALLLLEDLGLHVLVLDEEQKQALNNLRAASGDFDRVMSR